MVTSGTARRSARPASGAFRLRQRVCRELVRDVVVVDGDQRDRARTHRRSQALDHPDLLQPEGPPRLHLRPDQLARLRAHGRFRRQQELAARALVDWDDAGALADLGHHAQRPAGRCCQPAQHARLVRTAVGWSQPRQHPLARRIGGPAALLRSNPDQRRRPIRPVERARRRLAIGINAGDLDDGDAGQGALRVEPPAAVAAEGALVLHRLQHAAQLQLLLGIQPEGAGNLAFADARPALADERRDLFAGRKRRGSSLRVFHRRRRAGGRGGLIPNPPSGAAPALLPELPPWMP